MTGTAPCKVSPTEKDPNGGAFQCESSMPSRLSGMVATGAFSNNIVRFAHCAGGSGL